ncbi:hypothetical protein Patl1_12979 [Pistacia atlantica]|uniref:Uncharacterized protein n=1 Tax=Pistacia atlantica TaxID=434234 RepID=A0ACC1AX09_9ROSI|nr:hypothetical protein Patl1_12979 [Pistacia atlantica]
MEKKEPFKHEIERESSLCCYIASALCVIVVVDAGHQGDSADGSKAKIQLLRRVRKQKDKQLSRSPSKEGKDFMYLSGNDAEVGGVLECFDFSKKLLGMGLMKKRVVSVGDGMCPPVRDSEVTYRRGGHHHENMVSMSIVNEVKVQAIMAKNTTSSHVKEAGVWVAYNHGSGVSIGPTLGAEGSMPSFDHDGIVMGCPPLSIALKGCIGFANILIKVDATRKLPELIRMKMPMNENYEPRTLEAHESYPSLPEAGEKSPVRDSSKVPQGDKEGFIKVNHKGKGKADLKPSVAVFSANQIVISSNPIDPSRIANDIPSPCSKSEKVVSSKNNNFFRLSKWKKGIQTGNVFQCLASEHDGNRELVMVNEGQSCLIDKGMETNSE